MKNAAEVLKFFDWALTKGRRQTSALEYIPLPDAVVAKIKACWKQITDASAGDLKTSISLFIEDDMKKGWVVYHSGLFFFIEFGWLSR